MLVPDPKPQVLAAEAFFKDGSLHVQKGENEKIFSPSKEILLSPQSAEIRNAICKDPVTGIINPHTTTVGVAGYSDLSIFENSGVLKKGEYQDLCKDVLARFVLGFNAAMNELKFDAPVVITHGASELGVDKAARDTAISINCRQFGFNQPEWMFYVPDDAVPVYVGIDKQDYHHKFAAHTMVLLIMGGRDDAAYSDRLNTQQYRNLVLPCPILPFLMDNPPPAWDPKYDQERGSVGPLEWANKIPILDASMAHLRSVPLPEVQRLIAGEKTQVQLNKLVDYLVELAVQNIGNRFSLSAPSVDFSEATISQPKE